MCGILFTNNINYSNEKFIGALELMNHRGPDATGHLQINNFQFGHKRLKILDIDNRSNQPFYSKNHKYVIIFNGEIYNYVELAKLHNIEMNTNCDTELVVELFSILGPKCIELFEGMFAFIIFDLSNHNLFIGRDHLGVKPLYILDLNGEITISSEIASILELTNSTTIDPIGLRQYLKLRTFFNNRTIYKNISFFPAGTYYFNGKFVKYWSLISNPTSNEPSDEEIENLITESVQKRLISDVAVGSFLSGGIDSSIIAALSNKPDTWTIGFNESNEFPYAKLVSDKINSSHHETLINKDEFSEIARFMINKRREPLSVPNEVLLYKMSIDVKTKNTVILSGEGADELFFGYDRIFSWAHKCKNFKIEEFAKLYSYGNNSDIEIVEEALQPFLYLKKPIEIVAHFFQIAHLHGLLRRVDNSTMLNSVEARVPFVDNINLIEKMINQSYDYKTKNGVIKSPLKRIFSDILPDEIINRKKIGFPVPLNLIYKIDDIKTNPMDIWFDFNLKILFGNDFNSNDFKI
jgi:asparagine synthase (glutamine-hydrolysing)